MEKLADNLRSDGSELDLHEALKSPVSLLLGVTDLAADALEAVGIKSVFDLGTSSLFAQADSAIRPDWISVGQIPSDLLDANAKPASAADLSSLPVEVLRAISESEAAALKAALGVQTIRDFAHWPPRKAASAFVRKAVGGEATVDGDAFADKLRPAMGEYPTERVYYDRLLLFGTTGDQGLEELDGAISLTSEVVGANADKPAVGALVTLSQSWFVQGVTLGHMIHSLALAPGEATRVAVIDWSRRTSATTTESIAETEQLDNAATHSRAISEVQNAVANEMQRGGSMSSGWAESESESWTESSSMGLGLAGMAEGVTGALGFSQGGSAGGQWAESRYRTRSSSWSVGERSTSASMTQNVNDRTEQHATSVRNRRATAVREVSQSEHEQISTRVIANYNHMHALTVQYYEVVQVYRVVVRPHTFDRVLFLPFELIDFSAANALDLVARYRGELLATALTARVRGLIVDPVGQVEVRGAVRVETPLNIFADIAAPTRSMMAARMAEGTQPVPEGGVQPPPFPPPQPPQPVRTVTRIRRGPLEASLPGNARLVRISFEGLSVARVRLELANTADAQEFDVPASNDLAVANVRLADVESILLMTTDAAEDTGTIALHCEIEGRASRVAVPVVLGSGGRMQTVAFVDADPSDRKGELLAHLQSNRGYYTGAILQRLDSASLVQMLGRFSWNGRPLADQVEPVPVTVAGNYLVLRAPVGNDEPSGLSEESWGAVLAKRRLSKDEDDSRLVPIPTGGVFAEAVLGRSNSAEKLDITRFWNWQDSPIPLQPPEIAPITAGSRARDESLVPGQLGAPILNIMNPTSLPDPTGLSAILAAIANGNMFRDMSGLAGTQAAGQAMSAGTLSAATEAGRLASQNYKIAADQATEMAKTAADMWKVYQSNGGKDGGGSDHSVSAEGARINHGRDMDERGIKRPPARSPSGPAVEGGTGTADGASGAGSDAGAGGTDRMEPFPNELFRSDSEAGTPSSFLSDVSSAFGTRVTRANMDLPPEDEGSGLEGSGGSGNFGQDEDPELAELIDIDLGGGRNQLSGLDGLFRGARGDVLRARVGAVGTEFEVDPESLAMNVVAEEDDIRVWLSNAEVLNTVIGLDYWHEERPRIFAAMPAGVDPIPSRELADVFINEVGNPTGPRHAFPNSLQGLRGLAARLRFTEQELEAELGAATYASLGRMERHFLVRLWFNSGHNSLGSRQAIADVRAGRDPFIRRRSRFERTGVGELGPRRAASIRAVQAAHLRRQFFDTEFI